MHKPTLLYLHNGSKPAGAADLPARFRDSGLQVDYFWAKNDEFPTAISHYQGVFISGSPHGAYDDVPFIQRQHALIQEIAALGTPTLGVCFGSQILASALCGRDQVFRRATCEVGFKWLDLTAAAQTDPLTHQLDGRLYNFVWHNDEVKATHPDMTILASTADCPNQIWRYRDLPIWGIQGHPEVTKAEAVRWFAADRAYFEKDGADVAALQAAATEQTEAKTMLHNFMAICLAHRPVAP